jgi:hypothetical protein
MKTDNRYLTFALAVAMLLAAILGCGKLSSGPKTEWPKEKKIAGKEQKLSHLSGIVVDDKFAYVTMGGTLADQNEGTSGLRKVALDSGAVTSLDDGKELPQSETGGIAIDEKFIYWNAGGKIQRLAKEGGKLEVVAAEHVGVGIDMALDNEKMYWTNHGYYSANSLTQPSPIYVVAKTGGKAEIFADQQHIPSNLVVDEKYVYWHTTNSIVKQAKVGGQPQVIYQATKEEGVDELSQDADNLYFGFRSAGNSRWALCKVSKLGGAPQTLVKTYSLRPVVVDETTVYFFDEESMTSDAFCKVSKNGGAVTRIDYGYTSGTITQSKTLVYFGSLDDIFSFTK